MKLTMRLQEDSYDIIISRGALSRLGKVTNLMNRKVLVVNMPIPCWLSAVTACVLFCRRGKAAKI